MRLRFAANISTLFREYECLSDRYQAAKDFGFKAVETQFPYTVPVENLKAAQQQTKLQQVLINSFPGDISKGEFGFAIKADTRSDFEKSLNYTLEYATSLNCKRVHLLAGELSDSSEEKEAESIYVENIEKAVDLFKKSDITVLIEPITRKTRPGYFLADFDQAIKYIKKIDSNYLKLQLDIFHLQMICGNVSRIEELLPYTGIYFINMYIQYGSPYATNTFQGTLQKFA
ncbi:putative hydroxypyruvate isomerase [Centruroides sculpturatus]|uniref:putative hydroxypyruvate isomerase n=1 Tax=Centruroides sculpturatus TaxID=218467 RepID=UPI000C6D3FB5|nr:putative hydroxypyruvate isomerase [Centruroides sculpturatus]